MTEDSMHRTLDAALVRNSGPSAEDVDALRLHIEDWLVDNRWPEPYDLSHAILASGWLAAHTAAAEARGAERGARAVVEAVVKVHEFTEVADDDVRYCGECGNLDESEPCRSVAAAREAAARVEGGA